MAEETFGPYRIEELLGRGGMGEVHRAYDTAHERIVALKRLSEPYVSDEAYRARFRRESQIVARLREPHVIPIHAFGEIDGRLYLDMRLVEGADLKDLMAGGPLPPRRAIGLLSQVASALDAAHADGLVHRDVKPSNILVAEGDFVYLVDFGIARSTGRESTSITLSGDVVGTLDYMAPERFGDSPADGRVDVYALACVLFACLTGARPFPQTEPAAQVRAHLQDQPPRASLLNPALPATVDDVLWRGMAKNPEQRFPAASELMKAAGAALETPAAAVTPPVAPATAWVPAPPTGPATMWGPPSGPVALAAPARRWPWVVLAATVLVVAAAVTLLLVLKPGGGDPGTLAVDTGSPTPAPSATSGTPAPSSSSSTGNDTSVSSSEAQPTTGDGATPEDTALLGKLPEIYQGNPSCQPTGDRLGATAAVRCTQSSNESSSFPPPDEATFYSFPDRTTQSVFFQQLVSERDLTRDDSNGGCAPLKQTDVYGLYYRDTSGPLPGEYVTCFLVQGTGQLWWVDTRTLTVGELSSSTASNDDELDQLYQWWNSSILVTMR